MDIHVVILHNISAVDALSASGLKSKLDFKNISSNSRHFRTPESLFQFLEGNNRLNQVQVRPGSPKSGICSEAVSLSFIIVYLQ